MEGMAKLVPQHKRYRTYNVPEQHVWLAIQGQKCWLEVHVETF